MQGAEANNPAGPRTLHRSQASLPKNKAGAQWNQLGGETETQDMGEHKRVTVNEDLPPVGSVSSVLSIRKMLGG